LSSTFYNLSVFGLFFKSSLVADRLVHILLNPLAPHAQEVVAGDFGERAPAEVEGGFDGAVLGFALDEEERLELVGEAEVLCSTSLSLSAAKSSSGEVFVVLARHACATSRRVFSCAEGNTLKLITVQII